MAGFTSTADGTIIRGAHIQQFTDFLTGQKLDAPATVVCTSTTQYALTVQSDTATNGYIFRCLDSTDGQMFAVTQTGVSIGGTLGAVSGKLRDKNGFVVNLEAYTTATINTGVSDTDTAWLAAVAEVTASSTGKGTIVVGPGTFLAASSAANLVSGITVRGAGRATVIKHRDNSARQPLMAFGMTGVTFMDLAVDGNRTNNEHTSTGFSNAEVVIDGSGVSTAVHGNAVIRCYVSNFNSNAISCSGRGNIVAFNTIEGPATETYLSVDGSVTQTTFGGVYGILTPAIVATRDLIVFGNKVTGTRSAGIFVGGKRVTVEANHVSDCHRGGYPGTTPGGCIAIALTSADGGTTGTVASSFVSLRGNHIGPTTTGTFALGFEVDSCTDIEYIGNTVEGTPSTGFALNNCTRVSWQGGFFRSITSTAIGTTNNATASVVDFSLSGAIISNCATGVSMSTRDSVFMMGGVTFQSCTNSFVNAMTSAAWWVTPCPTLNSPAVPTRSYFNGTVAAEYAHTILSAGATNHGLLIQAGTSASQYAMRVQNMAGSIELFNVFGNGEALLRSSSATGGVMTLDTLITTSALRSVISVQEFSTVKWRLGMGTDDTLAVIDSAGTTALVAVDTAATSTSVGQVTVLSSSTANTVGVRIGRTSATEARMMVAHTANAFLTGSTAGDMVLAAATNIVLGSGSTQKLRVDSLGNIIAGNGTGQLAVTATAGFLWMPWMQGTPTGNPGTPAGSTGSVPFTINLSANTLHFWTGAAWRTVSSA